MDNCISFCDLYINDVKRYEQEKLISDKKLVVKINKDARNFYRRIISPLCMMIGDSEKVDLLFSDDNATFKSLFWGLYDYYGFKDIRDCFLKINEVGRNYSDSEIEIIVNLVKIKCRNKKKY